MTVVPGSSPAASGQPFDRPLSLGSTGPSRSARPVTRPLPLGPTGHPAPPAYELLTSGSYHDSFSRYQSTNRSIPSSIVTFGS